MRANLSQRRNNRLLKEQEKETERNNYYDKSRQHAIVCSKCTRIFRRSGDLKLRKCDSFRRRRISPRSSLHASNLVRTLLFDETVLSCILTVNFKVFR